MHKPHPRLANKVHTLIKALLRMRDSSRFCAVMAGLLLVSTSSTWGELWFHLSWPPLQATSLLLLHYSAIAVNGTVYAIGSSCLHHHRHRQRRREGLRRWRVSIDSVPTVFMVSEARLTQPPPTTNTLPLQVKKVDHPEQDQVQHRVSFAIPPAKIFSYVSLITCLHSRHH